MTITAKYPGNCKVCQERIHPGERIEWTKGDGAAHEICAMSPAQRQELEHKQQVEREYQERLAEQRREQAKDQVLYRVTPNQIAAMSREEAEAVVRFHEVNPPTMDYMTEYTCSLKEMSLAKQRIAELSS